MPDQERDPRVNPRRGDVLRDGMVQRKVTQEPRGTGHFMAYRQKGHGNVQHGIVVEAWRKWAATAEVIARAEDAATGREEGESMSGSYRTSAADMVRYGLGIEAVDLKRCPQCASMRVIQIALKFWKCMACGKTHQTRLAKATGRKE